MIISSLKVFTNVIFNPFHATGFFLRPLKLSEYETFSDVFKGCRKKLVVENGLKKIFVKKLIELIVV